MQIRCLILLFLIALSALAQEIEPPRVLIIGDSISLSYTPIVKKQLAGKALVERVPGNCRYSAWGAEHAATWVEGKQWDIIHFNFGLWDLYGWKQEELISVEDYGKNMETIVEALKPAAKVLVFGTTTPPCAEAEHKTKLLVTREKAAIFETEARRIMKKHGVFVNDLDSVVAESMAKHGKAPNDVHYTPAGNQLIANKVASFIEMLPVPGP